MYFWTALVLFFTSTHTCYMQPYQEALNSDANRIFPPQELRRGYLSSTPSTSVNIPKTGTGNNVLKKCSQSSKLASYGKNGRFPLKPETPQQKPEDMYIPFDYHYTTKIEEFVTCITRHFYACLTEKMQTEAFTFLSHYFYKESDIDDKCATEEIPEEPYYRLPKRGYGDCHSTCSRRNVSYVKFLNKSVRRLSEHFFSGRIYIKLHPIDANVGECVHNEEKKTYDCKCKSNYQITIDTNYYATVQSILNDENFNDRDLTYIDHFTTALFFLKFLPRTAPLYIAFVFFRYNLQWTKNDRRETYPDLPFAPPNVEGTMEETDLFRNVSDQLLEKIFETAAFEQLNIYILAAMFRNYC